MLGPLLVDLARRHEGVEVVFAYVGLFGRVNRLDVVLEALGRANRDATRPISLLLVGDGPEKPALRQLATKLGLTNVTFVNPIPRDRVPELLAAVDVGVVHATETPVYRYGISFNKVFDYMASRKPIAFACSTWGDPVAAAGAGLSVPPDHPETLAAAFVALAAASPAERRRMGKAGREYVEREHDIARIGEAFADIVGCADTASPHPGASGEDAS